MSLPEGYAELVDLVARTYRRTAICVRGLDAAQSSEVTLEKIDMIDSLRSIRLT